MHVLDMIFFWADMEPGRPAIMLPDRMLTYRGLANAIEAISARITEHNPDKNEPVAVALENETAFLATCFAALRLGFAIAPASRSLFPQLVASGIKTVVADGDTAPGITRILFDDSWLAPRAPSAPLPRNQARYGDVVFFTSGTTGTPKMSRETSAAGAARAELSVFLGLSEYSRALISPGLNTHFGFNLACDILRLGKTACFCPMGEQVLWMISTFCIDFIHASSNQALALCQLGEKHPEYSFSSVRTIRVGGAKPPKGLVDRVRSRLCKEVTVIYASTEASQAATAPYSAIEHVEDAVGVVVPWTDLEIVDQNNNVLPPGVQGKVRYRNAYFLNNQSENSSNGSDNREDWFYPGDMGLVTEDGILCIKGRSDDVINRGGVKVSAVRVEERLLACHGVKDAGVCGVEGLSEMTQLWIAVVPDRNFKPAEFRAFLQSDEALHQSLGTDIDQVFLVEEIPRGDLGKIKRLDLRNKLLEMLKAAVAGAR
jgi:acyl-coenzyme A synthetase/AMP-(fatty) acid ligase